MGTGFLLALAVLLITMAALLTGGGALPLLMLIPIAAGLIYLIVRLVGWMFAGRPLAERRR